MDGIVDGFRFVPINDYLVLCSILFCMGIIGVLTRKNALTILMSIELMINSVNLLLAAFSAHLNNPSGQIFVFFIMVVAAAEVAVGLSIIVVIFRTTGSIDINGLNKLKW